MNSIHDKTFPNENGLYRQKRNELLRAEILLRDQIEQVAKLRRDLPKGGKLKADYSFVEIDFLTGNFQTKPLSTLFGQRDTLIIYSFMFSNSSEKICPGCSGIVNGIDRTYERLSKRCEMVISTEADPEKTKDLAVNHKWESVRFVSALGSSYSKDYHAYDPQT